MSAPSRSTGSARKPERIVVVAGATGVGKTALAVSLCERIGGEIVSADSRQVYRRMEVGTAKPSAEERRRVRHHLIDVVDPDDEFDASVWRRLAEGAIDEIRQAGKVAVVCGGTGLYIRGLVSGLFDGPSADEDLRARLADEERAAPGVLHARLRVVDAEAAVRIHPNDMVRIVRALEVLESTGKPISVWQREHALAERRYEVLALEVALAREELYERINRRSAEMVEGGLVAELAGLHGAGYAPSLKAFAAIGYREAGMCLEGNLAEPELAGAVAQATRQYAKRQLVWIRGQMDAEAVADVATALARVEEFLHAVTPEARD